MSYLPLAAAAKRLGVSRWTLWRMVLEQQVPSAFVLRSGRKRPRIRISERFLSGQPTNSAG